MYQVASNMLERHTGRVKKWNEEKGFGFILRPGHRDVFVHRNGLKDADYLVVGDEVEYSIVMDQRAGKVRADNVVTEDRVRSSLGFVLAYHS